MPGASCWLQLLKDRHAVRAAVPANLVHKVESGGIPLYDPRAMGKVLPRGRVRRKVDVPSLWKHVGHLLGRSGWQGGRWGPVPRLPGFKGGVRHSGDLPDGGHVGGGSPVVCDHRVEQ